jgi:hypothetical protein
LRGKIEARLYLGRDGGLRFFLRNLFLCNFFGGHDIDRDRVGDRRTERMHIAEQQHQHQHRQMCDR